MADSKGPDGNGDGGVALSSVAVTVSAKEEAVVVVFDGNEMHNWCELFGDTARLSDGRRIRVAQTSWMDTQCVYYHRSGGCYLNIAPVRESRGEVKKPRTLMVQPALVIARNQPRGPTPASDRRGVLYGLMTAGVPAINSCASMYGTVAHPAAGSALSPSLLLWWCGLLLSTGTAIWSVLRCTVSCEPSSSASVTRGSL
jgi:hypothetical protein